jgi:hypothetical protein
MFRPWRAACAGWSFSLGSAVAMFSLIRMTPHGDANSTVERDTAGDERAAFRAPEGRRTRYGAVPEKLREFLEVAA